VLSVRGGAVQIAYPGPDKTVMGWVNATDLTPAVPPKP